MSQTSRFIGPLLHFLFPAASVETIGFYHACIRKAAHLTEYAVLASLAFRTVTVSHGKGVNKYRYLLSAALVASVAAIDEFNQSFEPSRTSSPYDVLLDIAGGLIALTAIWIYIRTRCPAQIE